MHNPPGRFGRWTLLVLALGGAAVLLPGAGEPPAAPAKRPIVIGHRGACGYRPEHTLASYEIAIALGADFIEPDLVPTKDGVLVARHENEISTTTDVASHPEFASRRTTKTIDGSPVTGWFTEDFTLKELKTLRAKERLPQLRPDNQQYDGRFEIPTLQELIDLAQRESRRLGRTIGIYPETKHPTYFRGIGLPLEEPLVKVLGQNGYVEPDAPVFIQSFEVNSLERLHGMTRVRLIQLMDDHGAPYDLVASGDKRTYADLSRPEGLAWIARYAQGIGPNKNQIVPRSKDGKMLPPTTLVADAHAHGLLVHPWTFRVENYFLPKEFQEGFFLDPFFLRRRGNVAAEYKVFFGLGVDGVFSDQADTAVAARKLAFP